MTDRQLLEAAACAVGYLYVEEDRSKEPTSGLMLVNWQRWDPLNDDAAAFRLAIDLAIDVQLFYSRSVIWGAEWHTPSVRALVGHIGKAFGEPMGADPHAATRKAIVRAAAAIHEDRLQEHRK